MAREQPNGRIEKLIAESLAAECLLDAGELARHIFGVSVPSKAQLVSVRRALRSLQRKGIVDRGTEPSGRRSAMWMLREDKTQFARNARRRNRYHQRRQGQREEAERVFREMFERKPAPDLAKMAKILAMLGSSHEGEVLNAARKAEDLRRRLGVTWDALLGGMAA